MSRPDNPLTADQADAVRRVVEKAERAAQAGNGEASYVLARLSASGVGLPFDLDAAVRHLQQAAERMHRLAQAEMAALSGNWGLATEIVAATDPRKEWAWGHVVDSAEWLRSPAGEQLSHRPRMTAVRSFLSPEVCEWLIRVARPHLAQAHIYDSASGGRIEDKRRSSTAAELSLPLMDTIVAFVRARIARLIDVPIGWLNAEACQIMHYSVGQRFVPHYDYLDPGNPALSADLATNGQRVATVLVYLNEGYDGGHTEFPTIDRDFKGRTGDALAFWNVELDGTPDPLTLHAGTPPIRGEKWLLSQWVRAHPSHQ